MLRKNPASAADNKQAYTIHLVFQGGKQVQHRVIATAPDPSKPATVATAALAQPGEAYAIYLRGGTRSELTIQIPAGDFLAEWLDPGTGRVEKAEPFRHPGGNKVLHSPDYTQDMALRIKRMKPPS